MALLDVVGLTWCPVGVWQGEYKGIDRLVDCGFLEGFGPSSACGPQGVGEEGAVWGDGPRMVGLPECDTEDAGRLVMDQGSELADLSVWKGGEGWVIGVHLYGVNVPDMR